MRRTEDDYIVSVGLHIFFLKSNQYNVEYTI